MAGIRTKLCCAYGTTYLLPKQNGSPMCRLGPSSSVKRPNCATGWRERCRSSWGCTGGLARDGRNLDENVFIYEMNKYFEALYLSAIYVAYYPRNPYIP